MELDVFILQGLERERERERGRERERFLASVVCGWGREEAVLFSASFSISAAE